MDLACARTLYSFLRFVLEEYGPAAIDHDASQFIELQYHIWQVGDMPSHRYPFYLNKESAHRSRDILWCIQCLEKLCF